MSSDFPDKCTSVATPPPPADLVVFTATIFRSAIKNDIFY